VAKRLPSCDFSRELLVGIAVAGRDGLLTELLDADDRLL